MKDKLTPNLSIVIPFYNKTDYLLEMICCIRSQSYPNWELILVDDGSDCDEYCKIKDAVIIDERIRLVKRERSPKNGNTCRNIGMDIAIGKYLMILDSDDLLANFCFERRVAFMEENLDCDYASFPFSVFFDGKQEQINGVLGDKDGNIIENLLSVQYPFTVWANIYRRNSIKDIRWDEKIYVYQDFDFMLQCAFKNKRHKYAYLSTPDYYYRIFQNGTNVCGSFVSDQKIISTQYLINKVLCHISFFYNFSSLKNFFLNFICLNFERLVINHKNEAAKEIVSLISSYYSYYCVIRLSLILRLTQHVNSEKYLKVLTPLYIFIFFGKKRFLKEFLGVIKLLLFPNEMRLFIKSIVGRRNTFRT